MGACKLDAKNLDEFDDWFGAVHDEKKNGDEDLDIVGSDIEDEKSKRRAARKAKKATQNLLLSGKSVLDSAQRERAILRRAQVKEQQQKLSDQSISRKMQTRQSLSKFLGDIDEDDDILTNCASTIDTRSMTGSLSTASNHSSTTGRRPRRAGRRPSDDLSSSMHSLEDRDRRLLQVVKRQSSGNVASLLDSTWSTSTNPFALDAFDDSFTNNSDQFEFGDFGDDDWGFGNSSFSQRSNKSGQSTPSASPGRHRDASRSRSPGIRRKRRSLVRRNTNSPTETRNVVLAMDTESLLQVLEASAEEEEKTSLPLDAENNNSSIRSGRTTGSSGHRRSPDQCSKDRRLRMPKGESKRSVEPRSPKSQKKNRRIKMIRVDSQRSMDGKAHSVSSRSRLSRVDSQRSIGSKSHSVSSRPRMPRVGSQRSISEGSSQTAGRDRRPLLTRGEAPRSHRSTPPGMPKADRRTSMKRGKSSPMLSSRSILKSPTPVSDKTGGKRELAERAALKSKLGGLQF